MLAAQTTRNRGLGSWRQDNKFLAGIGIIDCITLAGKSFVFPNLYCAFLPLQIKGDGRLRFKTCAKVENVGNSFCSIQIQQILWHK